MKVQINTPYWILIFRIKINNIDAKNILYFSHLAELDTTVSQKDETWLYRILKYSSSKSF